MTTPRDAHTAAQGSLDELGRRWQRAVRIMAWNAQMMAAVEVIRQAHATGRGVIMHVSNERNLIEARASRLVPAGRAAIFDLDREDPRAYYRDIRPEHLIQEPTC